MGVQLDFVGSSFVVHLEFIGGHWRLLENCWGFIWSSMGVHLDFVGGNWRLLGNSWGSFGVHFWFI